ncbi:MAG: cytochrome c family protein [Parvularculaceae bacterium]|nr:cytochrome c family protein [Parvularculaceae bacterium]
MQDPMFFNKIAAAMLVALLLFFGLPQLAAALRGGHHGAGHEADNAHPFPQYPVEFAAGEGGGPAPVEVSFNTLLANADPRAGERRAALCKSCHTLEKGGANGTGPNLWGVVGRPVASHEGFNYTGALKAAGGNWDFDRLSAYLENSQSYIPGTAMVQRFPKAEQRAEIIAYLNTLSDSPHALPAPDPEPAAADEGGDEAGEPASDGAASEEQASAEEPAADQPGEH